MFYKPSSQSELSQFQMDRVRKGFTGLLWRVLHNPEFIANNADELIAIAHTEYVRAIDKGVEIEDPIGWTIHCAWRRTQNLLTQASSRPQEVSSEKLGELIDETKPTPAQVAEDTDRTRKIRRALANLDVDQRQLMALMYFEEMPLAEAARELDWHESKARRCHKATLKQLHKFLGVQSSDELEVEIGLVAWLSLVSAGPLNLVGGVEAVLDKAGHEASGLWARAHDLARRFGLGGGGDAASAAATSGAGRAAGVCATIAVACVAGASGVVGPGVGGGIELFASHDHPHRTTPTTQVHRVTGPLSASSAPIATSVPVTSEGSASANTSSASSSGADSTNNSQASPRKSERRQVRDQVEGFARASSESSATRTAPSTSASASTVTGETTSSGSATSSSSPEKTTQAQQQFGAFK